MIKVPTKIKIPFLWGKAVFSKHKWSQINWIVGPNGSGKTLLAEQISSSFKNSGYELIFLKSDRQNQENLLATLKNDEAVRLKIQKVLSNMFSKSISFIEDIDGTYIPIVKNKSWNVEYMLEDAECHGLKEIITLLVCLYSAGSKKKCCIIFDEPELHLHPQFQSFFMNELRNESLKNSRNVFFLVTHSPFFIDLRSSDDLIGVVVCHTNKEPTFIEELSNNDDNLFRRFLPRFNTYHKQFFFSDNQIFVEGYTDQQMFTNLLPFVDENISTAGTGIIDVGGKDELGVFCKVCSLLGTSGRIITDLDSLFSGKLREVFCKDYRVEQWLEKQKEKQQDFYRTIFSNREMEQQITLDKLIYRLERMLIPVGNELTDENKEIPSSLSLINEKLMFLQAKHINADNVDTYKTVILQAVVNKDKELENFLSPYVSKTISLIKNLYYLILAAAESAKVYILPKGCIEHYYTQNKIEYMPVSAKDRLFHNELEFIKDSSKKTICREYSELITLLTKACN